MLTIIGLTLKEGATFKEGESGIFFGKFVLRNKF